MGENKKAQEVYVIQQVVAVDCGGYYICCGVTGGGYEGFPVRAFTDPDQAKAYCQTRELEARKEANPFAYGEYLEDLGQYGYETYGILRSVLADLDLPGPDDSDIASWEAWWPPEGLSEEQAAAIWDVLDEVRFFEVHSTELIGKPSPPRTTRRAGKGAGQGLFLIQQVNWIGSDTDSLN
jgi:hypothetical protein